MVSMELETFCLEVCFLIVLFLYSFKAGNETNNNHCEIINAACEKI